MTTKKQKRAAAMAKREEFMAKVKADGLAAQERDRQNRRTEEEILKTEIQRINDRHRRILQNATPDDWARARSFVEAISIGLAEDAAQSIENDLDLLAEESGESVETLKAKLLGGS